MRIELANLENGRGSFTHKYAAGELTPEDDRVTISQPPEVQVPSEATAVMEEMPGTPARP